MAAIVFRPDADQRRARAFVGLWRPAADQMRQPERARAAGRKDFRMLNHDQAPESAPRLETSSAGLVRRLGRLFDEQTGRSVIVAMDHGATGVPSGFADPRRLLCSIVAARPDGVILNTGLARRFAPLFGRRDAPALVLGIDNVLHRGPHGQGPADAHWTQISVEEAVKLGADAVKVILIMGRSGALSRPMT